MPCCAVTPGLSRFASVPSSSATSTHWPGRSRQKERGCDDPPSLHRSRLPHSRRERAPGVGEEHPPRPHLHIWWARQPLAAERASTPDPRTLGQN
ncbi:MAG: DUF1156 domain-containing protein [Anaerolineae bacterium]